MTCDSSFTDTLAQSQWLLLSVDWENFRTKISKQCLEHCVPFPVQPCLHSLIFCLTLGIKTWVETWGWSIASQSIAQQVSDRMSYCLSAFLSVEKRAGEIFETQAVPSMSVPVCCRVMCISLEQMERCLSGHAKTQALALSRVHSILQTYQGCIVASGHNLLVAQCSDMDWIAAWLSYYAYRSWTLFHDEVVCYAAMHRNVARPELCLCKWPPVQMRRFLSHARGEEDLLSE